MEKQSQKERVLRVLKEGKAITSMDGFMMGIVRLTARIFELRRDGFNITDKWRHTKHGAKYKVYFMDKLFDKSQL